MNSGSKRTPVSLYGLVQVIALFTLVLSIGTCFTEWHRWLELFSHFKAQYWWSSAVCLILFTLNRKWGWALMLAPALLINSVFLIPWYWPATSEASDSIADLQLAHLNVHTNNSEYSAVLKWITSEQPDIVFLQEVNSVWADQLSALEFIYPYQFVVPREDNFGIAAFSRIPFKKVEVLKSGPDQLPSLQVDIELKGEHVTIFSSHPVPPVNTRYYKSRNIQLQQLALKLNETHGPRILTGDLNIALWSHHYHDLVQRSGLTNARAGNGLLSSWPTFLPLFFIPIDHFLISSHWRVNDLYTGPDIGSDHLPLIIRLSLIKGAN